MEDYTGLVKSLRWLSYMFPETHPAKDDTDRISNNIHLYCKSAADAIEELQAQLMFSNDAAKSIAEKVPKWIPVTERLPECDLGAEVGNIEWISYGRVYAGCFGRGGKYRDAYFRTWTDAGEGIDAKEADYWRAVTLPEPPKEET